ncbi:hypothetical protein BX666DRAFT_1152675 [Dichotomocladium elegans]|nr:hypothetical protein BX666DRAFT_1152675 [Dichotomocladium elegans]
MIYFQGITSPAPLSMLESFSGAFFWGLDEMHLLGSNVGPHLWTMLTNPVSESPFLLSNAQKTLVSTSLRRTKPTWPSVFDGKIKDVLTRTSDTRAVDYIDMLIYFIPTAVLEVLEEEGGCSDRGAIALASLIKACAISLSWEITDEDISAVERCINTWQGFALDEVPGNLHTINMHYLRHLPEALRQFGPLRTVSARSMERTVGLYDKRIRSTKAPGKNAGNQMLHISAQRHYYRVSKDVPERTSYGQKPQRAFSWESASTSQHPSDLAELWPPHLNTTTICNYDHLDLFRYLRAYWMRQLNLRMVSSLPSLEERIVSAKRLYVAEGITYSCSSANSRNSGATGDYVKLDIEIDLLAHRSSEKKTVMRSFFGEALLFFAHKHGVEKRILCLLRLSDNVKITKHGYPYGEVGVIPSPTKAKRYYYVYHGMHRNPIEVGNLKYL